MRITEITLSFSTRSVYIERGKDSDEVVYENVTYSSWKRLLKLVKHFVNDLDYPLHTYANGIWIEL